MNKEVKQAYSLFKAAKRLASIKKKAAKKKIKELERKRRILDERDTRLYDRINNLRVKYNIPGPNDYDNDGGDLF